MNKYTNETDETKATKAATVKPNAMVDWFIRLIKGIVIGIGFILPGLSGGVFAVILGIYDKLIQFLSDIRKKFLQNIAFFFPVAIGMAIGIVIFSIFVEKAFGKYAAQFICLFVGFVVGTFPSLYKTAGKEGRSSKDLILFAVSTLFIFVLMMIGEKQLTAVPPSFPVWMGSGALIGLGVVVPGMSPSNFLIYFGLYDKMAIGIKDFDFGVIIPLIIGLVVCVLMFAKLAAYLFRRYYSEMYHFILGMVAGSSLAIFPTVVFPAFHTEQLAASGLSFFGSFLLCIAFLGVGVIISYLFSKVEEKYPREEIF
jgi:putative membrane protein